MAPECCAQPGVHAREGTASAPFCTMLIPCALQAKARPAASAAAPPKPLGERQLPPVPRFDEQRPASVASRTAAADVVTTAAPVRQPLAPLPASRAAAGAAAPSEAAAARPPLPAAAGRQQVVLQACGAATQGAAPAAAAGEEDETAPVVMSKLAQRVQRGRQSLAPSKIVLGGDGSLLHRAGGSAAGAGTPGMATDDDDTLPVAHRPDVSAAPAAEDGDADATRPLARAAAGAASKPASPPPARPAGPRVQIDGAGNINMVGRSSAKPLPVPPPPPPALSEPAPAPASMPPPPARVPMGPPPPKAARPAAAPVPGAAQSQAAARPGRRVVEDENTVTVKVCPCCLGWLLGMSTRVRRCARCSLLMMDAAVSACSAPRLEPNTTPPVPQDITYTKLECVGRGGSSKVYKVSWRRLQVERIASAGCSCGRCWRAWCVPGCRWSRTHPSTHTQPSRQVMAPNRKIFALKRIRLTVRGQPPACCGAGLSGACRGWAAAAGVARVGAGVRMPQPSRPPPLAPHEQGRDAEAASGFLDEISLLNSLTGWSNIIQLIDSEVRLGRCGGCAAGLGGGGCSARVGGWVGASSPPAFQHCSANVPLPCNRCTAPRA